MKFSVDHDYHCHSFLSPCSSDPAQNTQRMLQNGLDKGFRDIVVTDHFWDSDVPCVAPTWENNVDNLETHLPLPQADGIRFHLGGECDVDACSVVGISKENTKRLEFIIIPLNHLHLGFARVQWGEFDFQKQANIFTQRFWNLTQLDLPFHKMGLAHISWEGGGAGAPKECKNPHLDVYDLISDDTFRKLFREVKKIGMGVEVNLTIANYEGKDRDRMMRPLVIAKEVGCKFYVGSDAHHPSDLDGFISRITPAVEYLNLTEDDKFRPFD